MKRLSSNTGIVNAITPGPTSGWVTRPRTVGRLPSARCGSGHSALARLVMPLAMLQDGRRQRLAAALPVDQVRGAPIGDDGPERVLAAPGVGVGGKQHLGLCRVGAVLLQAGGGGGEVVDEGGEGHGFAPVSGGWLWCSGRSTWPVEWFANRAGDSRGTEPPAHSFLGF